MKKIRYLVMQSYSGWTDNNAPRLSAALAFYTILSISPLVIFAITVVSLVFSRSSAQGLLLAQAHSLLGSSGKDAVESMLRYGTKHSGSILSSLLGLVTLVFGASGVFTELRAALNTIWKVTPKEGSGLWTLARERLFSFGMVFSVGFILLVSLLASAVLAAITKFFSSLLPVSGIVPHLMDAAISFVGVTFLFAMVLKYVPETEIDWRDVRLGAVVTSFLFTAGKSLLALYLGMTTPGSAYGAAGSLVAMVIWVYYSAQIFYFGAELTHACALYEHDEAQGVQHRADRAA
jgi:membrane protein